MTTSRKPKKPATVALRLFFYGPGVGESIAVQLPCGQWGVIDCCLKSRFDKLLNLFSRNKVERLAFLCLTHPHADHFTGMDLLINHFKDKIDRIWRYPGFTAKDIQRVALAADFKGAEEHDTEATRMSNAFRKAMLSLRRIKKQMPGKDQANHYRRIIGPVNLMKEKAYEINALKPDSTIADRVEKRLRDEFDPNDKTLLLRDDDGGFLNSLSVVLQIKFGKTHVLLMGDAQGASTVFDCDDTQFSLVKFAHHGSSNGLWCREFGPHSSTYGVITHYSPSSLPTKQMIVHYESKVRRLIITPKTPSIGTNRAVPAALSARSEEVVNSDWIGLEIASNGTISKCTL